MIFIVRLGKYLNLLDYVAFIDNYILIFWTKFAINYTSSIANANILNSIVNWINYSNHSSINQSQSTDSNNSNELNHQIAYLFDLKQEIKPKFVMILY